MKIFFKKSYTNIFKFSNSFKLFTQVNQLDLIKTLRAETNSPLNHIKKALEETNNNLEEAKLWLKKKGFKDAENRMKRQTKQKLYTVITTDEALSVASLSCETDFVSNTDIFQDLVRYVTVIQEKLGRVLNEEDLQKIKIEEYVQDINPVFQGLTIEEGAKYIISKTQENCKIDNLEFHPLNTKREVAGAYLHAGPSKNHGTKGAFVVLSSSSDLSKEQRKNLKKLADSLSMQIVASTPKYLYKEDIPAEVVEEEKKIITDSVMNNQDPNKKVNTEKIIESKLKKFFEEICLYEQQYVIIDHDAEDDKLKVKSVLTNKAKENGIDNLSISSFKYLI